MATKVTSEVASEVLRAVPSDVSVPSCVYVPSEVPSGALSVQHRGRHKCRRPRTVLSETSVRSEVPSEAMSVQHRGRHICPRPKIVSETSVPSDVQWGSSVAMLPRSRRHVCIPCL